MKEREEQDGRRRGDRKIGDAKRSKERRRRRKRGW